MEESSLSKTPKSNDEMQALYLKRRATFFASIIALIAIAGIILLLAPGGLELPEENESPKIKPPPVFEKPPKAPEEEIMINETADVLPVSCMMAPLEDLGCLELNDHADIFDAYGMKVDDKNVRNMISMVESSCRTDAPTDRDCIVHTTVVESDNSWVCEWDCLEDLASCETYKMHLAVAVLRNYVPAEDVFVGRTDEFDFFIIYKNNEGDWIQPQYTFIRKPEPVSLYNDVYHAGPITEVHYPEVSEVEPGDSFCLEVDAPRSCVCSVEVSSFTVGNCPQLPADLRGICDDPVSEVYLTKGKNPVCFEISEDAEEEFYTYKFALTGGEEFMPAGNAFIKERKWDCCVNATFEGFLSVGD